MDLGVDLNIILNLEQIRHEAQMLCKGTNEVITTLSHRRNGALARTQSAVKNKGFSGQVMGM